VLIDTHCHLGDAGFDGDRVAVVARARAAGVQHIVVVAENLESSVRARGLARDLGLSATAGVHPHDAASWNAGAPAELAAALDDPVVVAVGETGLDYHYDFSRRPAQRAAFRAQIEIAARHGRPVVVHCRDADDDMASMLRDTTATVVLHSFSAGPRVFEAGLEREAYFSFSGMVTFRNWAHAEQVAACPADRLLLETDAPYLAPYPNRGKRNEPAWVRDVAARVAELRGETLDQVARVSSANAARVFGRRVLESPTRTSGG
jgi:TatD DNase family protein